jgi:hypothetical protein
VSSIEVIEKNAEAGTGYMSGSKKLRVETPLDAGKRGAIVKFYPAQTLSF